MQFIQTLNYKNLLTNDLKTILTLDNLTNLCASISSVTIQNENQADIYCLWGAFNLKREEIRYGVRFSLIDCPHALAWTVTVNENVKNIIINCTTDKSELEKEFIESIHEFLTDWKIGIDNELQ